MLRRIACLAAVMVAINTCLAFAISIDLPKTGQTTSYTANDDGSLQKGTTLPSPRFSDNGDGTITDNLTGLMWVKDANITASAKTWQEALDFIDGMNLDSGTYYGYSDWRLPNRVELRSLVDHSQFKPALTKNYPFTNIPDLTDPTTGPRYWTSTTDPYTLELAWYVNMYDGDVYVDYKTSSQSHYVWPVRGTSSFLPRTNQSKCYDELGNIIDCSDFGQTQDANFGEAEPDTTYESQNPVYTKTGISWPDPRFTDNGNGTLTDSLTGLLWIKDGNLAAAVSWQGALDFVTSMNSTSTYGHTDWRLPNINELSSLINDDAVNAKKTSTWLNSNGFENIQEYDYWTSTTDATVTTDAWRVFMRTGYENAQSKTDSLYYAYVLPVTDSIIEAPTSQKYIKYSSTASAAKSTDPARSKPIGVGSVATNGQTVSLEVSIGKFSSAVDVYLAIYSSGIDPSNIFLIKSDYTLQALSAGLSKFKENTKSVNNRLFSNIKTSSLTSGTYTLYMMITPAGDTSKYYLYETNFTIQ